MHIPGLPARRKFLRMPVGSRIRQYGFVISTGSVTGEVMYHEGYTRQEKSPPPFTGCNRLECASDGNHAPG